MTWPHATDYNAAVQNPQLCFRDEDLRQGQTVGDPFGLPRPHSGNFADVYQIQAADGQSWAVKCFTRPVSGLRRRYHAISEHLRQAQRAFMVEFHFLDEGVCIRGQWHPIVKMRWVEGLQLNEFVREHLSKPVLLGRLAQMWIRLALELHDANMAHGDLQHGNVLLVPSSKNSSLALKLVDYDGMFVPSLAHCPSGEVGHANYQHPRRLREGNYDNNMDRFSHLLIYTALRCLRVGGLELWQRYDNLENLLFREQDFRQPRKSTLLRELWDSPDRDIRHLVGHLLLASQAPVAVVPALDDLVGSREVRNLSEVEVARINDLLDDDDASLSRDRKGAETSPLPSGRGTLLAPRSKPQTAIIAAPPTVDELVLTDTQPVAVKSVPPPLPKQRPNSPAINLDAQSAESAAADRASRDVGTLADPLISLLSQPAWLATLGVIALISFLVINVLVWSTVKQPPPPSPRPTLADIEDVTLEAGRRTLLHFTIKRHNFHPPLTVRIEGLPNEVPAPPPLLFPVDEDKASLTLLPPLGTELPPCEPRVSLWDGNEKIDEKTFHLSLHTVPRPLLKALENISCQAGRSSEFDFGVQRNGCREPLQLRLEGLPPQVWQESAAAADADTLTIKLTVAHDCPLQNIPAKLLLHVGDVVADSKALLVNIHNDAKPTRSRQEQQATRRVKSRTPGSLTVEPGQAVDLPVELERENGHGEVRLHLAGLPAGASAVPVAVPGTRASATVTVRTTVETKLGEHQVKLRVQMDERTVDERDIILSVRRPRGQQESVHFPTVDHIELAGTLYHGWKGKHGMTVLMLHDLGRDRNSPGWKHLAEALQAEGHTVLTFDFRGHGESKKVSPPFWKFSVNKFLPSHDIALPAEKQTRTLEMADLQTWYRPWLIEDIAAARAYLDLRHDEPDGPINTFNLVLIGAGQASALGSLWLGTEGVRYNAAEVSGKTKLLLEEKRSVLQVVWLGMTDPLKLRPDGIYSWLRTAAAPPVVPITFVYGGDDIDTRFLLDFPIREKYGTESVIPGESQSGQDLLDKHGKGAKQIKQYLVKKLQKLPPIEWMPRRIKDLRSFWGIPQQVSGGRRWYAAKLVGDEVLRPVPFHVLHVPAIKGLAEPQPLPNTVE